MTGIRGVCSFAEKVDEKMYAELFKGNLSYIKKNLVIKGENIRISDREGCFLCISGKVENTESLKEDFGLFDKKEESILLSLYLEKGEGFIKYLRGSFIIIILDEMEKEIHIFTDKAATKAVYLAGVDGAFIFSDTKSDILNCFMFSPVIDKEGILRLFALPCAYCGEEVRGIHRIMGNLYGTVSDRGASIYSYKAKTEEFLPEKMSMELPQKGDSFLYNTVKYGEIKTVVPPHIFASAMGKKAFTNGHLLLLQNCKGYEELMKEKYDFSAFAENYNNKLLCDLDFFSYETDKDIERVENFYLYYSLYLQNANLEISRLCNIYGLENNTTLLKPCSLKALFMENKEKMLYATSGSLYLTQDIRQITAELCKNKDEPIFEIVSRHRLFSSMGEVEDSYLLFLLRVNRFLEIFKPYLELS